MQNVLQMEEKMAGFGVQQPMTTREIKNGASVKVSSQMHFCFSHSSKEYQLKLVVSSYLFILV